MKLPKLQLLTLTVISLGVFFRFNGLGNKLYSHDEAYTSLYATGYTGSEVINRLWDGRESTAIDIQRFLHPSGEKDIIDTLSLIVNTDPAQSPLYYVLAHYWIRVIGYTPAAMRSLAALLSLFAIPGLYWLSLELFQSRRIALLSVVLISLSPFNILFAQDARPYSLWASMTLLSSAALMTAIRKNKKFIWGIYSLFLVIGIYSHQLFALVFIAHGLYMVTVKESRVERRFTRYLVASFLALLTFTPWLFQTLTHWNKVMSVMSYLNTQISWWTYIQRWALIFSSPFIDLYVGPRNIIPYILRSLVLLFIGYALFSLVVSTPKRVWTFLLLLIGVTTLPLILMDLFRDGIRSIQGRYFISANVATIPVVAHLLGIKLGVHRVVLPIKWLVIAGLLVSAQTVSGFNILWEETWWTKNLSSINPQIVYVLNQDTHPLLIVSGAYPTNLGDVLALSYMVDRDVCFKLNQDSSVLEISGDFSDIYLFNDSYSIVAKSGSAGPYQVIEVVPDRLWRVETRWIE